MNYNILYLVSTLENTGPNKQQYYIFKYLNRKYFKPFVLTLSPEPPNSLRDLYQEINVPVKSLMLSRLEGFLFAKRKIKRHIKENKISLLHSFGLRADEFSLYLNIPNISSIRNYPYQEYPTLYNRFKGTYIAGKHIKIIEKKVNNIVCSSSLADSFKENNGLKLKIIQNGIDTTIYYNRALSIIKKNKLKGDYELPIDSKIFLSASNLIPRKNIRLIIDTFIKYFSNDSRFTLIIAGDGQEKSGLELEGKKYSNIIFLGNIINMVEVYQISDYFISASFAEGLPNSVLEAMSCGLPCLLSNIPMHTEIIAEASGIAKIFDPRSTKDLYDKFIEINELDYTSTSKKCSEHILNYFNARTMSKKYQSQYLHLMRS